MNDSNRFHNKAPTGSPVQNMTGQAKPHIVAAAEQNKPDLNKLQAVAASAAPAAKVLPLQNAKKEDIIKKEEGTKKIEAASASAPKAAASAKKSVAQKADKKAATASTASAPIKKLAATFKAVAPSAAEQKAAADHSAAIVTDTAAAMSQAAAAIHGKFVDMMVAQSDAAFAIWRSTLSAGSVSEAIKAQSSGLRQAYETGSAQIKDLAGVTEKAVSEALEPVRGYWGNFLQR
jgi:hypothetical protein